MWHGAYLDLPAGLEGNARVIWQGPGRRIITGRVFRPSFALSEARKYIDRRGILGRHCQCRLARRLEDRNELQLQSKGARMRGWRRSEQSLNVFQQLRLSEAYEVRSSLRARERQSKRVIICRHPLLDLQTGCGKDVLEHLTTVLVAQLRPNALTLLERDLADLRNHHLMRSLGDQVHFHPVVLRTIECAVLVLGDRKISAELPVQPLQDIEIESCGDALRIVVGTVDHGGIL